MWRDEKVDKEDAQDFPLNNPWLTYAIANSESFQWARFTK